MNKYIIFNNNALFSLLSLFSNEKPTLRKKIFCITIDSKLKYQMYLVGYRESQVLTRFVLFSYLFI